MDPRRLPLLRRVSEGRVKRLVDDDDEGEDEDGDSVDDSVDAGGTEGPNVGNPLGNDEADAEDNGACWGDVNELTHVCGELARLVECDTVP